MKKTINPSIIAEVSRLLGAQGGLTAAKNMTKTQRAARAKKASIARWGKKKKRGKK